MSRLANTPALFARADEVGAVWVEDRDMGERHLQARLEQLDGLLAAASHVYLTIDLDVLPAAVMPGVSAPAPYGVPMAVVEEIACASRPAASSGWPIWPSTTRVSTWMATAPARRRGWPGSCCRPERCGIA